jgi:hypothetical protein
MEHTYLDDIPIHILKIIYKMVEHKRCIDCDKNLDEEEIIHGTQDAYRCDRCYWIWYW